MKRLLVLGAGTAGTMVVNKLRRRLDRGEWRDHGGRPRRHPPLPAGVPVRAVRRLPRRPLVRPRHALHRRTGSSSCSARSTASTPTGTPCSSPTGAALDYDYLVIATGTSPRPDQTPGMLGAAVAAQHLRLLHLRRRRRAARRAAGLRPAAGWSCTSSTCRSSARSLRWSSPSSPRRTCADRGMPRPGRAGLRDAAAGRVHQADRRPRTWARMLDERKIAVETDFLVERIDDDRRRWSPTTSGRSRSTCWSRSR